MYSYRHRYVKYPLFTYRSNRTRPYAYMSSIREDYKADKALTGNELGE